MKQNQFNKFHGKRLEAIMMADGWSLRKRAIFLIMLKINNEIFFLKAIDASICKTGLQIATHMKAEICRLLALNIYVRGAVLDNVII